MAVMERAGGATDVRQAVLNGDLVQQVEGIALYRLNATERLSEPFTLVIEVVTPAPVDFGPHLGLSVGVEVNDVDIYSRDFSGRLFEARSLGGGVDGHHYELTARPWFSLLDLNLNSRVFQDKKPLDVIKEVLGAFKFRVHASAAGDKPREYCNQYRESDFAFVSRLLEEEGFYYFFEHTAAGEQMVICGGPAAHQIVPAVPSAEFHESQRGEGGTASFSRWSERIAPVPSVVTLSDSQHLLGGVLTRESEMLKQQAAGKGPAHVSELFDYPGGNGVLGSLARLAKARLEAARAENRLFSGEGDLFALACGAKVALEKHPTEDWNQDYLIVGATHSLTSQSFRSGGEDGQMVVSLELTPFETAWKSPLKTPKPVVAGPTTALVIGETAIDVDEHSRVLVKFMWDRREGVKAELGVRIRVSQGWAGGGYGLQNIPRVGTEVVVDFVDGDPDLPLITGRLHAKDLKPPLALPANKTQSTWKSQTVGESGKYPEAEEEPSGVGFNEIRLEDKGGSEEVYIHAQRLRSDWTRFDEKKKVGRDLVERIGRDRATAIKRHETVTIETGDETRTLQAGSRTTVIKKADKLTLNEGDSTLMVEAGNIKVDAAKGKIAITAMQEIKLTVGKSVITMTPKGVDVEGTLINVKAKGMLTAEGAMTTVKASGILTAEGKLVMIN